MALPGTSIEASLDAAVAALTPRYGKREATQLTQWLAMDVFDAPWFEVRDQKGLDFPPAKKARWTALLNELLAGNPIQYVLGYAPFYGRDFEVGPGVLIPRPETEELMVWVREKGRSCFRGQPLRVLDVGTGSGCLPISLYWEWSALGIPAHLTGLDISEAALTYARNNAARLEAQVSWVQADLQALSQDAFSDLDLLVSNPPYVLEKERADMAPHVREHEPGLALFVPDEDPLKFYRLLAGLGRHWLKPGGWLLVEIHQAFGQQLMALFSQFGFHALTLRKDMRGNDRMIGGKI